MSPLIETASDPLADLDLSAISTAFDWPESRRRAQWNSRHIALDATRSTAAARLIRKIPARNETLTCVMAASFNMSDLLAAFVGLAGRPARSATILTLGFNQQTTSELVRLVIEKQIGSAAVICSSYFSGADRDEFDRGKEQLAAAGIPCVSARCHAKVLLMDFGKTKLTASGSGNFRTCRCIEQLTVTTATAPHQLFARLAADILESPSKYA